jgi:hypothetical protein
MITKLQDWKIFEKKQKNAGIDMVIVDVQDSFKKYFGDKYVEALDEFCTDYKRVFQIWDNHDAKKPDYAFPNQCGAYEKRYGGELDINDVENFFPEPMWDTVKNKLDNIPNVGDMFETLHGDVWVYIDSNHKWFLCSKELFSLFNGFKKQQRKIVLVGGAINECLQDIYVTMTYLGVSVSLEQQYLYSFKGSNFK